MKCVPELIRRSVRETPEAVALAGPGLRMTYAQLDAHVDRLADALAAHGAARGRVVGVVLPRGWELVAAVLAVHRSGAAYLPLDPELPVRRREQLLGEAGARIVVADDGPGLLGLPGVTVIAPGDGRTAASADLAADPGSDLGAAAPDDAADDAAYVVFTSGSTGRPKPVVVSHGALAHHGRAIVEAYGLTSADRVLQFANPAFDVFAEEVFPTLMAGATLVVPPGPLVFPADVEPQLRRERVTVANLPTPFWDQWTRDLAAGRGEVPDTLRLLIVGSDVGYTDTLARWWRHCSVPVINAYGLTETTITSFIHRLTPPDLPRGSTLPIGCPLPGMRAYLLDDAQQPVPDGMPGELYVGGPLLALGYAGQPAQTAQRFLPDPIDPQPRGRLYRTGDLAVRSPDGALEFKGRRDDQVKIRGQRVEPAEVAAALRTLPGVHDAHVCALDDPPYGSTLGAYVVATDVTARQARAHLADRLPSAMVPSAYVFLRELPRTANGKVDHRALPQLSAVGGEVGSGASLVGASAGPSTSRRPTTPMEHQVAAVWREVLGTGDFGLDDGFFDVGGHSLLLVQVQRRLTAELGRPVAGAALFAYPTVRALAAHLAGGGEHAAAAAGYADRAPERRDGLARLRRRAAVPSTGSEGDA